MCLILKQYFLLYCAVTGVASGLLLKGTGQVRSFNNVALRCACQPWETFEEGLTSQ